MRKLHFRRRKFFPLALLFLLFALSAITFFYVATSPVFTELAKAGGSNHVQSALYSAIYTLSKTEDFSDLASFSQDNGKITSISLNQKKANRIRSLLATEVNRLLADEDYSTFSIPAGNITKIPLLSGRGTKIPVRIVPLGSMEADIISDFSDAGINQTKHSVYIKIRAKVHLMAPFYSSETETETTVPLSETIIVGDVPGLYASGLK